MSTSGNANLVYAYGIVRADFSAGGMPGSPPPGLDGRSVTLVRFGDVAALVSRLPASEYSPETIAERSGEVAWLSPRALAHDQVLTWAQEHSASGVVPLPMFSMWGSEGALERTLEDRSGALAATFQRVAGADEFGLRVHRRDAAMLEAIDTLDEDVARLRREAAAASTGQRYLLERKIAERAKTAVRAASQRMARKIFADLRSLAREALSRPLTPDSGKADDATMVLNGAFLVARDRLDAFRAAVAARMAEHEPKGLRFDFTGPWPPYNFVGDENAERDASPGGNAS